MIWLLAWVLTGAALYMVVLCWENPPVVAESAMLVGWALGWPVGLLAWWWFKAYGLTRNRAMAKIGSVTKREG